VYVSHEDYRPERLDDIAVDSGGVDFVMEKRGLVMGQIIDAKTGRPIQRFRLYAGADRPYQGWMERSFKEHDDPEGRFTYKPNFLTERIFAQAEGYAVNSALAANVLAGQSPTKVTIALEPGLRVAGIVVTQDGAPVSSVMVFRDMVPSGNNKLEQGIVAVSDSEGEFSVESLPDGPVTLVAWHEKHGFGQAITSEQGRTNDPVRIVLTRSGGIEGVITLAGEALAGQRVVASVIPQISRAGVQVQGPRTSAQGETAPDGTFRFTDMPVGTVVSVR
jgi:hypothetical protein